MQAVNDVVKTEAPVADMLKKARALQDQLIAVRVVLRWQRGLRSSGVLSGYAV